MRKLTFRLLLFILFSFSIYVVNLFFWAQFSSSILKPNLNFIIGNFGHLNTRLKEVKQYKNVDILFLGTSRAYRGFDPRIFSNQGYKTFNLGSSAQTPIQTKVLLQRYLNRLNPKIIIYEVYPSTFEFEGYESSLDLISNDKNDFNSLKMIFKLNNIKLYNTFIYSFTRELFKLDERYHEPIKKNNDYYINGGFVEKKMAYYKSNFIEKKIIKFNKVLLKSFEEIIIEIQKRNIPLILVYAPLPFNSYERYSNNDYFDFMMKSYSKYYNFNKIKPYNDSLFYDSEHLNQNGVKKFNFNLLKVLNTEDK